MNKMLIKRYLQKWAALVLFIFIIGGCNNKNKSAKIFEEAKGAVMKGNIEKALQLSEESLKYNRSNIEALRISSEIYEMFGKFDEAVVNWLKLEELKAESAPKIKFRIKMLYIKKMLTEKYYNSAILANQYKQYDNSLAFCDSIFLIAPREMRATILSSQMKLLKNNELVKKYFEEAQTRENLRKEAGGYAIKGETERDKFYYKRKERTYYENGVKMTMVSSLPYVDKQEGKPLSMAGLICRAVYEADNLSGFRSAMTSSQYATDAQKEGFNRIFDKWGITENEEGKAVEPTETQLSGAMWDLLNYYDSPGQEGAKAQESNSE